MMTSIIHSVHLPFIGWEEGDPILSDEEILDRVNAIYSTREAAKQVVLTKLGITAEELASLLAIS